LEKGRGIYFFFFEKNPIRKFLTKKIKTKVSRATMNDNNNNDDNNGIPGDIMATLRKLDPLNNERGQPSAPASASFGPYSDRNFEPCVGGCGKKGPINKWEELYINTALVGGAKICSDCFKTALEASPDRDKILLLSSVGVDCAHLTCFAAYAEEIFPSDLKTVLCSESDKGFVFTHAYRMWKARYEYISRKGSHTSFYDNEEQKKKRALYEPYVYNGLKAWDWEGQKCLWFRDEIENIVKEQVEQVYKDFKEDFKHWKEKHMSFTDLKGRYETALKRSEKELSEIEQSIVTGYYSDRRTLQKKHGVDVDAADGNRRPLQRVKISLTAFMEDDNGEGSNKNTE